MSETETGSRGSNEQIQEAMTDKKNPWWMLALLGVLATALPVLAILQYRWIGAVSEGERARMQRTLRASLVRFVDDVNRPLERVYEAFMPDAIIAPEALAAHLTDHYRRWQSTAEHPDLLDAICWVDYDTTLTPHLHRLDTAAVALLPHVWPDTLAAWHDFFAASAPQPTSDDGAGTFAPPAPTAPPGLSLPTLPFLQPAHASRLRNDSQASHLLLLLNQTYITETLFPALAHTYFITPEATPYDVLIVQHGTPARIVYRSDATLTAADFDTPDVLADLGLTSRTDITTVVSSDGAETQLMVQREDSVSREVVMAMTQMTETVLVERDEHEDVIYAPSPRRLDARQPAQAKGVRLTKASDPIQPWRLLVRHRAGSIEAAIGTIRRRTLGIGFGILVVLGGAAVLLFISARRARRLAEQQVAFVAGVTHELRTPLAIIRSAAENLADGVITTPEQAQRYGTLIHNEGRRLSEIVEQALTLAGAHSTHHTLDLHPVPIATLVQHALTRCRPTLDEQTADVTLHLAQDLPLVQADAHALEAALCNLITNASKYGGPEPCIRLDVTAITKGQLPMVQIVVRDYGPGIPADELPHLFEPFYRGRASRHAQIRGSGLGLSLVKSTIEAHGGEVVAQSTPGAGSTFTIYLPAFTEA